MPIARGINTYINDAGETKPIDIYYTIDEPQNGSSNGETLLYVTGLGCQLIHSMWNAFVAPFTAAGYRVVRFDNRETGKSTKLSDLSHKSFIFDRLRCRLNDQSTKHQLNYPLDPSDPIFSTPHNLPEDFSSSDYSDMLLAGNRPIDFFDRTLSQPEKAQFPFLEGKSFWNSVGLGKKLPCWELSDVAMDAVLLMNHLGIDKFHVQGVSMGGMISQYIAAIIPSRILSLTLVMTSTGNTWHNASISFLLGSLILRKAPSPTAPIEKIIAFAKETQMLLGVNDPEIERSYNNHQDIDSLIGGMIRRAPRDEKALLRQMEAIDGQESRDRMLDYLAARIPILIFHGKQDQLVPTTNAPHMFEIAKQSLSRQVNPPITRHPDDTSPLPTPNPFDIISTVDGRREVTTAIGRPYQGRRPYTTLCLLDKAAHDITDDFASFLVPQHLAHMDAAVNRVNIMQPLVLPVPQWGNEPDICYNCPDPALEEQQQVQQQQQQHAEVPQAVNPTPTDDIVVDALAQPQQEEDVLPEVIKEVSEGDKKEVPAVEPKDVSVEQPSTAVAVGESSEAM